MNNFKNIKIPKEERLEVQLLDGTEEHNIVFVITSLAKIKGDKITKTFKLYSVSEDGEVTLEEKGDTPEFKLLQRKED